MECKIKEFLYYVKEGILENLYFRSDMCIICKEKTYEVPYLCSHCLKEIKFCKSKYYISKDGHNISCYSMTYYAYLIKDMILGLKYKKNLIMARIFSCLLYDYIKNENIEADFITFVPMIKKDKIKRGYNQSEEISRFLSKNLGIAFLKTLKKVKKTKDQIGLNKNERWENLKGFVQIDVKLETIKDKSIILIDDVITTGATAYYCYEELMRNGAKEVFVITVAKSNFNSSIKI